MRARRGDGRIPGRLPCPLDAAIGASAVFAAAGERAAAKAQGPGGLAVGLLDELYRLGRPELVA